MKLKREIKLISLLFMSIVAITVIFVTRPENENILVKVINSNTYTATTCEAGYYLFYGKCTLCPAGSYCNSNYKYSCPLGKGSLPGSRYMFECGYCAKGYYGKGQGCVACPTGTYQDKSGQSSCISCPTGTYQDKTGQTSCIKCAAGTYQSKTGQKSKNSCIACKAGTYSKAGQATCTNCATGTYQNKTGQKSCISCPTGTYQDQKGKTSCKTCAAGTYQNKTGQKLASSCKVCTTGTYQNKTGQASCIKCAAGTYQDKTGQKSCKTCENGKYQDKTGQNTCKVCAAGTGPNSTKTACVEKRTCKKSDDPQDEYYNSCIIGSPVLVVDKKITKIKLGETITIHATLPKCGKIIDVTRMSHGGSGGDNKWSKYVDMSYENIKKKDGTFDWVVTAKKIGSTCISQTIQYDVYSPSGKCSANIKSMINMCINITR